MPAGYEFFEHTADIGVHIYGATQAELFRNAATALYEALGKLQKSEVRSQKSVALRAPSWEDLLHDWLAELLYEVEANHVLYDEIASLRAGRGGPSPRRSGSRRADTRAQRVGHAGGDAAPTFELQAELHGGPIDFARSQTNEEIKAVTYHQLRVERLADDTWRATVIFDV